MSSKGRKGAKARERDGQGLLGGANREREDLLSSLMPLMKAFNEGTLALPGENARLMHNANVLADMKVQRALEETMGKIANGEFDNPDKWEYGDGDQSPLKMLESQNLRTLWGKMMNCRVLITPTLDNTYFISDLFQRVGRTIPRIQMLLTCRNG